jgi:hypothetical protein
MVASHPGGGKVYFSATLLTARIVAQLAQIVN